MVYLSGLSPLARGNRPGRRCGASWGGPIPARAGQPAPPWPPAPATWAYPRSRGATRPRVRLPSVTKGLSPLARGNPQINGNTLHFVGPIPARAGQPQTPSSRRPESRAYPRSRGATNARGSVLRDMTGLSPLARDNRVRPEITDPRRGPIPARAGQPRSHRAHALHCGAYPRSRGATNPIARHAGRWRGLSPLARGNPPLVG